ncbi:acetoacetate--CoA ligase [Actinoplanes teichomyceticus]|uniref:Acetoacetyl-CoA synthetase n=1 Tax=Actinoplanes teichomyceticus TaxID=1867 RepID=A0A561VGW8_ACTTI|nr:acetoacetate--CoA ligase [Actinoplanes teichomyceticus]TWG10866.1 acetoacetyl-CoA synthetase [Actinoplanes teichomyceticus]GIF12514.1 acetoacetyl-CoA synthetase [Actinoplanes teichomyceticus]
MTTGEVTAGTLLWEPPADIRETSRIGHFLTWLERERGLSFPDYAALWEWSVTDLSGFWGAIWDHFGVLAHRAPDAVLGSTVMPGARWFPGAALNYAENVLRMPGIADDEPVVLAYSQTREPRTLTARQLREQVRRVRAGLKARGVGRGDRVAAYAPNIPETYVLMLAAASLGATFSSCAPEFGARSVIDRWRQIEPKVLVAVDGYRYGDRTIDRSAEIAAVTAALPSLEHVITIGYLGDGGDWEQLDGADELAFEPVPFDHPLYVLYSSGTTGLPKPIVHGHGGILLEHLKTLALHHDLGPADRFFWFTTTGWMMWNYLASGPAVGAAIVLFDGNPAWPGLDTLWDLVDSAGITYFGTSAPFLMACRKAGLTPGKRLKGIGSTGAPLPPEGFAWVYRAVGRDLQLMSLSGGTDVCTGFVGGAPLLPVRAGVIAGRSLGARVEAYDPAGHPVIGELGELVISAPMPSMPVGFWNDTDGSRYREAYFDVFPGVWRHGDWITIGADGSCVITGRSDATLNRGGVRLGTSEFYSVVESLPEVADSLVVHLDRADDPNGELLLFVVPAEGVEVDDALRARIARQLRSALSPRHVPDTIHAVRSVPRTLSAKKLEVPVKRILTGTPVESAAARGALANPESLNAFAQLARERAAERR